jgi:hypothetical protein
MFFIILSGCKDKLELEEKNLCNTDICNQYYNVWKHILMTRSNMSEEYFNNHIFPYRSQIWYWNEGESFLIYYQVKIGWMLCNTCDDFIIKITTPYIPLLTVPRNVYLDENTIDSLISTNYFDPNMKIISPVENLKYDSQKKALKAMHDKAGNNKIKFSDYKYYNYSLNFTPNGHPYMTGFGTIDESENKCISGEIDLVTGDCEIYDCECKIFD